MGRMIGPMFEDSPLLSLPLLALAMFLAVFLITFVRTYAVRDRDYAARAALPLDDGDRGGDA